MRAKCVKLLQKTAAVYFTFAQKRAICMDTPRQCSMPVYLLFRPCWMPQQSLRKVICTFCCCEPALSARVSVHCCFLWYCVSGFSTSVYRVSPPQSQLLRGPRHTLQAMPFVLGDKDEAWWPGSLTNPFPHAWCFSLKVQAWLSECILRSATLLSSVSVLIVRRCCKASAYLATSVLRLTDRGEA